LEVENMTDFMVCQDWKWGSIKNGLENIWNLHYSVLTHIANA
jgi:hypothetical protein